MTPFVILSLVASAFAAPQLPAGLTAAACPNYPYCDATGGFLPVPDVPGAGEVIAAQEAIIRSHQGVGVPALPGLEAHAAAEAAVQQQSRAGFPAHAAAVNAVLLSQGRLPEGVWKCVCEQSSCHSLPGRLCFLTAQTRIPYLKTRARNLPKHFKTRSLGAL